MFRNTAEANDCERIKPAKFFFSTILASLEGFAFQIRCPLGDVPFHQALDNILPSL